MCGWHVGNLIAVYCVLVSTRGGGGQSVRQSEAGGTILGPRFFGPVHPAFIPQNNIKLGPRVMTLFWSKEIFCMCVNTYTHTHTRARVCVC